MIKDALDIKCWIPIEIDDPQIYLAKKDAQKDIESLERMQSEIIYEVVEVQCASPAVTMAALRYCTAECAALISGYA